MRRVLAVATSLVVAGSAIAVTAPPAAAKKTTYKACVKKKTGEMRILIGKKKQKKKCKKGWKKTTWKKAGPKGSGGPSGLPGAQGATGAKATMGTVFDANGAVVGEALEVLNIGLAQFSIRIDGGIYTYYGNGLLLPAEEVSYSDAACNSSPFSRASSEMQRDWLLFDAGYRPVYRATSPTIGPASAFALVGTSQSVTNAQHYYRNGSGVCTAYGSMFTGYVLTMTPVTAPSDRPGPLTIR